MELHCIDADTFGELYDGFAPVDNGAVLLSYDDDGLNDPINDSSNFNFCIEYELSAGQAVYIKVGGYAIGDTYDYYFIVSKVG
ncbi:MAG: hypothetical protein IKC34_00400 [Clostridia bacterium]|nr:hypothetical protein [Clostridia bacterium]